jgi:hypothetical protein
MGRTIDRRLGHTDAMAARKCSRSDTAPSEGTTVDEMEKAVAPEYHLNEPNSEHGGLRNVRQHSPPSALQHLRQSWCNPWRPCSFLITLIGRLQQQCLPHLLPSLPLNPSSCPRRQATSTYFRPYPSPGSLITWLVEQVAALSLEDDGMDVDEEWESCFHSASPSVHHEEYDYMDIDDDSRWSTLRETSPRSDGTAMATALQISKRSGDR